VLVPPPDTVARLFQTLPVKVAGKFGYYRKYCVKQLFRHLLYNESKGKFNSTAHFLVIPKENSKKIQKIIGFLIYIIVKIFSGLFSATFARPWTFFWGLF
jgi:hypothetical protein